jgi:chemotaxis protein MotB
MGRRNPFGAGNPAPGSDPGAIRSGATPPASLQPPHPSAWFIVLRWAAGTSLVLGTFALSYGLWTHRLELRNRELDLALLEQWHEELILTNRHTVFERDQLQSALQRTQQDVRRLTADLQNLEREHRTVTEAHGRLESEMRTALQSRDITISELAGKLTVNILDRVLFASGEAEIKAEGQEVLRKVAEVLRQFPDRQIHVIGHTDNVPIRTARFPSNWELSAARAIAAVRFLTEQAEVDPRRLGALGHGEFHPVADNNTPEGRAQNRRIAIVVLPEALLPPAEIVPQADQAPGPS